MYFCDSRAEFISVVQIIHANTVLYSGAARRPHRGFAGGSSSVGSLVRVSQLFFNLPLRRRIPEEVERVRACIQRLALAHPHVHFVLVDADRNSTILQVQAKISDLFHERSGIHFSIGCCDCFEQVRRSESVRARFGSLFDANLAQSLIALPAIQQSGIQLDGMFIFKFVIAKLL